MDLRRTRIGVIVLISRSRSSRSCRVVRELGWSCGVRPVSRVSMTRPYIDRGRYFGVVASRSGSCLSRAVGFRELPRRSLGGRLSLLLLLLLRNRERVPLSESGTVSKLGVVMFLHSLCLLLHQLMLKSIVLLSLHTLRLIQHHLLLNDLLVLGVDGTGEFGMFGNVTSRGLPVDHRDIFGGRGWIGDDKVIE